MPNSHIHICEDGCSLLAFNMSYHNNLICLQEWLHLAGLTLDIYTNAQKSLHTSVYNIPFINEHTHTHTETAYTCILEKIWKKRKGWTKCLKHEYINRGAIFKANNPSD